MNLLRHRNQGNKRQGTAVVELAIVLPIFLLLIFGMVELGRAFMVQHLLSEASRMGARKAIVEGASKSEIKDAVKNFCASTLGTAEKEIDVDIEVLKFDDDEHTNFSDAKSGDMCSVTVSIRFDKVSLLPAMFLKNSQLTNTSVMERE